MKEMKQGFTLIELLVVIAIIGSLSALLVPNFMSARERARDAQRKNDIKQLQKALELYKLDQDPPAYIATASLPAPCVSWSAGSTMYMNQVPTDPSGSCSSTKKYYYKLNAGDSLQYELYGCMENSADTDANIVACPGDFEATAGYACTSTKCYKAIQP